MRLSLGATRARLVRQLLTESLLLAFIGGALGILVGYYGKLLLPPPVNQAALIDWRVIAFVFGVTTLTGIVFGIAPALRATGVNVNEALKQTGRSVTGGRSALGKTLLVVQVAVSLMLLVGALPPHAAQPAAGRHRLQSPEPPALPDHPVSHPFR